MRYFRTVAAVIATIAISSRPEDAKGAGLLVHCPRESSSWSSTSQSRIGRGRHPAALPGTIDQIAASRSVEAVSRRSRNRTRPWSIRASGTAKVGTMTSG
jgi:hypothetical protein